MPIVSMLALEGFGKHEFEIHFVSLLAMDGFGQHMLRYILWPRAGIGGVW